MISAISGAITYGDFTGIKGFHFVLYSSLFVYSIYLFHQFISQKSFKLFLLFMLSVLPHLLVINRGGLMLIVSSCLVIIIMKKGYIKFKMFLKLIIFSLVLLSLFGIMGNLRSKYSRSDDNYILDVGGATPEFRNSIIPKVYFWSYIYIASPLGNLQYIIDYRDVSDFGVVDLIDFGVNATMPNFVSKRISPYLKTKFHSTDNYLVIKAFNVATMYFIPYYILGWWGLILMYLFVISVVISYVIFVKDSSRYFITGWSIICSIMLFSMFSNMWSSMGLTSVIIVFVLSFFERVRIKF
ncbi:MAG: oligosaccharide repeat unit polymerase [Bacteroidales bacterium]|nr:oligosaccharide repeat unit polymerase [Bacteroidales bacterium]